MLSEADQISGAGEFVSWISGALATMCRMLVGRAFQPTKATRPLEVTFSAFYLGAASPVLLSPASAGFRFVLGKNHSSSLCATTLTARHPS